MPDIIEAYPAHQPATGRPSAPRLHGRATSVIHTGLIHTVKASMDAGMQGVL